MPTRPEVGEVDSAAIRSNVDRLRERIAASCRRASRADSEVTLIAVTKTFPPDALLAAMSAGVTDFGENRVQELLQKAEAVPGLKTGGDVRWHMIGHLQRNKARDVVHTVDLFHALDSERLARELSGRAEQQGIVFPCLVQVNTSGESSKSGVAPEKVHRLLEAIKNHRSLKILGFMNIAAPAEDPEAVRPEFRVLREMRDRLSPEYPEYDLDVLSMGMSQDFEVAIEEGATHVRVGSSIFGHRE